MGWLVRKISRAKWEPKPELEPTFIAADAVTIDLRTSNNRLSLWECDQDQAEAELSKVAVALAGSLERPDKLDIAWFEKSLLESIGVQFEKTEGDTPLTDLKCLHVDAVSLDLSRIEQLSRLLAHAIRKDENHRRFTKTDILELLCQAVREGRLSLNDLRDEQEKLREAVRNRLAS
jgi:hypothetical protein